MKKVLGLFIVAVAALSLAACGSKDSSAKGYGLVHKHYVAEVSVTVNEDKVKSITFEEYFLPYNVGALKTVVEGDNVVLVGESKTPYAKYVSVDGVVYIGEDNNGAISYKNDGKDIEVVVKDEAAAKAYVEAAKAGKVFIVDAADATVKSTTLVSKVTAMDKTTAKYWPAGGVGLGWEANMKALSDAFVQYGVDAEFTKNADTKLWETVDGASAATLNDFLDYQAVAKRAVANAK